MDNMKKLIVFLLIFGAVCFGWWQSPATVFVGDSITAGWRGHRAQRPFPTLSQSFGMQKYFPLRRYVNRGVSHQTCADVQAHFESDIASVPIVHTVHILCGVNDLTWAETPESVIESEIGQMIQVARARQITVIVGTLTPVRPPLRSDTNDKICRLNNWIRSQARDGVLIADYGQAFTGSDGEMPADLTNDGLHPNPAGYKLLTATFNRLRDSR